MNVPTSLRRLYVSLCKASMLDLYLYSCIVFCRDLSPLQYRTNEKIYRGILRKHN